MSEVTAEMIERGRHGDPENSARRRKLSYKLRETREKLTSSGSGVGTFNRELLRSFATTRKSGAPGVVGLALTIAAISTIWVPITQTLIWMTNSRPPPHRRDAGARLRPDPSCFQSFVTSLAFRRSGAILSLRRAISDQPDRQLREP